MSSKRAAMSSKKIEDLLQQCLEGYDGGMTPDECLSAFPAQRSVLEPLLRQALTLRMSYASAPSEGFMARAKESLMFHAGRDVVTAMSVEPNEDFKMDARQRLIEKGIRQVTKFSWQLAAKRVVETYDQAMRGN